MIAETARLFRSQPAPGDRRTVEGKGLMGIFANQRYQEVVVHDLRTPLNVISLAMRMIDEIAPGDSEISEDLALIRANAVEQERMLTMLVDYSRLPEGPAGLAVERFDPRRMLEETAEEHREKLGDSIDLSFEDPPTEVELDQTRARLALQKALGNVSTAAAGKPIRVRLSGGPDRMVIELAADAPPKESVRSLDLSPDEFERILGSAAERRGLDLAIAARVSALFGGSARLEARPGKGTSVVLDWPARLR